ncbi:TIGR02285 family protein [Rhodoferax sp. GW822-FHT02A01]|uniref:TIGR02285 family protein n=1 Tax=Rhodoferax sp. GW822-FHT02A01 TaxID=3141537 RepID=UPI00315CD994
MPRTPESKESHGTSEYVSRRRMALAIGAIAWGLCCPRMGNATELPTINWMVQDIAPIWMLDNGRPTTGTMDAIIQMLMDEWPDAKHEFTVVSTPRALSNLSNGVESCLAGSVNTPERAKFSYHSPAFLVAPPQLIARPQIIAKLAKNSNGEILPATLFDRADMKGLIEQKRSYGPVLDALLSRRSPNSGIHEVLRADAGSNLLKMVALGRGDYFLEYDTIFAYQLNRNPELRSAGFITAPVAGNAMVKFGFSCPKTEWGRRTIKRIDALMIKFAALPEFQAIQWKWQTPSAAIRYRKIQEEFFRQRSKLSDPSQFDD